MDFVALPPEITSALIDSGPGAESLIEASGGWQQLGTGLEASASAAGHSVGGWASAAVIASWSEASHRDVIASRYGKGVGAAGSGAVAARCDVQPAAEFPDRHHRLRHLVDRLGHQPPRKSRRPTIGRIDRCFTHHDLVNEAGLCRLGNLTTIPRTGRSSSWCLRLLNPGGDVPRPSNGPSWRCCGSRRTSAAPSSFIWTFADTDSCGSV